MWTAVTLWIVNAIAFAVYAAFAGRSVAAGDSWVPWIVGVPLIYFGIVLFLCALYFAIAWFWRARRPPAVRIGWRATLRLLAQEYATLAGAAPRMMFHGWLVRDPPPTRMETPVLLLHGVLCNAGVWLRLSRYLKQRGVAGIYSLSYGPPLASIETFGDQLAHKIDSVCEATGARSVMVVSHSMGGLVVRAYIRKYGMRKLTRVLTIGAPHHGSMHAWLCIGTCLAQMRPGNAWLMALNRERLDPALHIVSLWSWHDSMVAPQTSSELPGAIDVTLIGVGHNALLGDAEVFERTHAEISAARTDARRHEK